MVRERISGSDTKKLALRFSNTSLMSDMNLVCMMLVKGCQTLVMDPTSLLQQSLVNTVPHIVMVYYTLCGWRKKFRIWHKTGLAFYSNTSLMSGMNLVSMMLVKGCQTLVMDPTSLLQQSLFKTITRIMMVYCTLCGWCKKFRIWHKTGLAF